MKVSRATNGFTAAAFAFFVMVGSAAVAQDAMMAPKADAATPAAGAADKKDIVDTAVAAGSFKTLGSSCQSCRPGDDPKR